MRQYGDGFEDLTEDPEILLRAKKSFVSFCVTMRRWWLCDDPKCRRDRPTDHVKQIVHEYTTTEYVPP